MPVPRRGGSSWLGGETGVAVVGSRAPRRFSNPRTVRLSIVMPAYNEQQTVERAIWAILDSSYACDMELIVVDDGSKDETPAILSRIDDPRVVVCTHRVNKGKGAAVLTGASAAAGTHLLVFDADLEYSPEDIGQLLRPVITGLADIVYGSRIQGNNTCYQSLMYALGGRATTWAANILFTSYIRDLHSCMKLVPLALFRRLQLTETGFGLDTEVTARILRLGMRPFEVPVSYNSRTRAQGKKIVWKDGVDCLRILTRVRSEPPPLVDAGLLTAASRIHWIDETPHEDTLRTQGLFEKEPAEGIA